MLDPHPGPNWVAEARKSSLWEGRRSGHAAKDRMGKSASGSRPAAIRGHVLPSAPTARGSLPPRVRASPPLQPPRVPNSKGHGSTERHSESYFGSVSLQSPDDIEIVVGARHALARGASEGALSRKDPSPDGRQGPVLMHQGAMPQGDDPAAAAATLGSATSCAVSATSRGSSPPASFAGHEFRPSSQAWADDSIPLGSEAALEVAPLPSGPVLAVPSGSGAPSHSSRRAASSRSGRQGTHRRGFHAAGGSFDLDVASLSGRGSPVPPRRAGAGRTGFHTPGRGTAADPTSQTPEQHVVRLARESQRADEDANRRAARAWSDRCRDLRRWELRELPRDHPAACRIKLFPGFMHEHYLPAYADALISLGHSFGLASPEEKVVWPPEVERTRLRFVDQNPAAQYMRLAAEIRRARYLGREGAR